MLRRGFKTEAKKLAVEVRQEIGVGVHEELDPYALAELYGVRIFGLDDLECFDAQKHFTTRRPDVFSAALIPIDNGVVVVENRAHAPVRRRSTLAHEMAHVLLEHPFETMLVNADGCRIGNGQEPEATEFAGELLIPSEAARRLARTGANDQDVASQFGVSADFARWRMNATGARKIAARQKAAYQRRVLGM